MLTTDQVHAAYGVVVAGTFVLGALAGRLARGRAVEAQLDAAYDEGMRVAEAGVRREYEPDPAVVTEIVRRRLQGDHGDLLPELPDWNEPGAPTIASLRDEAKAPGEVTGPFTITDLPGPDGRASDTGVRAGGHHYPGKRFVDLALPSEAELEMEWSWGKVAHQIVQARVWMDSGAWDIPTEVAA